MDSFIDSGKTRPRAAGEIIYKNCSALAIGTAQTLWTPTSGKRIRLLGGFLGCSTAITVNLKNGAGGTILFKLPTAANVPFPFRLEGGGCLLDVDAILQVLGDAAGNLYGYVYGTEE